MRKPLGPLVWGYRVHGGAGTLLSGSAMAVLASVGRLGCARAENWVKGTRAHAQCKGTPKPGRRGAGRDCGGSTTAELWRARWRSTGARCSGN